jgi:hypothetical protein
MIGQYVLTNEQLLKILELYDNGTSYIKIAKQFNVHNETIRKFLRSQGRKKQRHYLTEIEKQEIINKYINGQSSGKLGKIYNVSSLAILSVLKKANVPRRNPSNARIVYPINHNSFSILTSETAYWIGFLMADGCILDKSKIQVALQLSDKLHLENFKKFLKTETRPIQEYNNACCIKIHSEQIVNDVAKYGVVPRKSLKAKALNNINNNISFWLGELDGDGTIDIKRNKIRLFGSYDLMIQFSIFIHHYIKGRNNFCKPAVFKCGSIWEVAVCGLRAANFLKEAYEQSTVFLQRKQEKANLIIQQYY